MPNLPKAFGIGDTRSLPRTRQYNDIAEYKLRRRPGWTIKTIRELYPNPRLYKCPRSKGKKKFMKLYNLDRVQEIEKTKEFEDMKKQALRYQFAARRRWERQAGTY
jgi:hypothetical protein